MRVRIAGGAALIATCVAAGACDERLSDLTGPTPNLTPTFSSIQREILETTDPSGRQACTGCHAASGGRGAPLGLDLTPGVAYANLVNVASRGKPGAIRVIPGDPANSYLVHKLEGRPAIVGERMPRGTGPFLTEGQMAVIRRWIELGAAND
jgi:hypothetical protein